MKGTRVASLGSLLDVLVVFFGFLDYQVEDGVVLVVRKRDGLSCCDGVEDRGIRELFLGNLKYLTPLLGRQRIKVLENHLWVDVLPLRKFSYKVRKSVDVDDRGVFIVVRLEADVSHFARFRQA